MQSKKAWISTQMSIVFSWNVSDSLKDALDSYEKGLQAHCLETIEYYCHIDTTNTASLPNL